jgi:hypothetical protein
VQPHDGNIVTFQILFEGFTGARDRFRAAKTNRDPVAAPPAGAATSVFGGPRVVSWARIARSRSRNSGPGSSPSSFINRPVDSR